LADHTSEELLAAPSPWLNALAVVRLVQVAMEYQPDSNTQEEVQTMSTTLGQTLEELAEQRGIEQGIEQQFPVTGTFGLKMPRLGTIDTAT
jgi:hypothetical protein